VYCIHPFYTLLEPAYTPKSHHYYKPSSACAKTKLCLKLQIFAYKKVVIIKKVGDENGSGFS